MEDHDSIHTAREILVKYEGKLPKVFVFDLDKTCWPVWLNYYPNNGLAPYSYSEEKNTITDKDGFEFGLFPAIEGIFTALSNHGEIKIAAATRNHYFDAVNSALKLMRIRPLNKNFYDSFDYLGLNGDTSKKVHFEILSQEMGIPYSEMVFFDDMPINVKEVGELGVVSQLVTEEDGVTMEKFEEVLKTFASTRQ
eukprot:CAMPEP_0115047496 /NCGR_PEP_ID=MMETSP0216-20121206/49334_1 /TAXON_ID=223996 /ORGANISM="Protocruzia adherens, Strain Boccale" /LENGTH=194 /DNA_ID=CAMNT_0002430689 /DNA_START=9 /DNA_END=593 /DNA_ORIENTATION=-